MSYYYIMYMDAYVRKEYCEIVQRIIDTNKPSYQYHPGHIISKAWYDIEVEPFHSFGCNAFSDELFCSDKNMMFDITTGHICFAVDINHWGDNHIDFLDLCCKIMSCVETCVFHQELHDTCTKYHFYKTDTDVLDYNMIEFDCSDFAIYDTNTITKFVTEGCDRNMRTTTIQPDSDVSESVIWLPLEFGDALDEFLNENFNRYEEDI